MEQPQYRAQSTKHNISPERQAFDQAVQRLLYRMLLWGNRHWLVSINTVAFVIVLLPTIVAPGLMAFGWTGPAQLIFSAYSSLCHQMPTRSFFIFGEQMALCHRMFAIHASFFFFGVVYILFRRRLRSLPTWLLVIYSLPMALDGFTQLFGWRESTWELRLLTGGFFGLAVVWYTFPHLEMLMRIMRPQLEAQLRELEAAPAMR